MSHPGTVLMKRLAAVRAQLAQAQKERDEAVERAMDCDLGHGKKELAAALAQVTAERDAAEARLQAADALAEALRPIAAEGYDLQVLHEDGADDKTIADVFIRKSLEQQAIAREALVAYRSGSPSPSAAADCKDPGCVVAFGGNCAPVRTAEPGRAYKPLMQEDGPWCDGFRAGVKHAREAAGAADMAEGERAGELKTCDEVFEEGAVRAVCDLEPHEGGTHRGWAWERRPGGRISWPASPGTGERGG